MPTLEITQWGGGNWADPAERMFLRAFVQDRFGNWLNRAPAEASDTRNTDFFERALAKRKGSALNVDLSLDSGELVINAHQIEDTVIVCTNRTFHINSGSGFTRIVGPDTSTTFSHSASVGACSFLDFDGRLFMGRNGANQIAIFRPGQTNLDPLMATSATYVDSFGGGTSLMQGTFPTGASNLMALHGRLCWNTGDHVVEHTDANQAWDRTGGGFFEARADIVAMRSFVPRGGNELQEMGFLFTEQGPDMITGFSGTDVVHHAKGLGVPLTYRSVCAIENWLVMLTREQGIRALNAQDEIDLGRRLFNNDAATGPLDTLDATNSNHAALTGCFYDKQKKQWLAHYPDGAGSDVNRILVLDFKLGEPIPGEPQSDYEQRVRHLLWTIKEASSNPWFVAFYQVVGEVRALTQAGVLYNHNSGLNDLGSLPVLDYWDTPELLMGLPDQNKRYRRMAVRSVEKGSELLYIDVALNRDSNFVNAWNFSQINPGTAEYGSATYDVAEYATPGSVRGSNYVDRYAESARFRFRNQGTSETWAVQAMTLDWQPGHRDA